MPALEDQLELEQEMVDVGSRAYLKAQRAAEEKGRGDRLDYARILMQNLLDPVVENYTEWLLNKSAAHGGRAKALLRRIDPGVAVFIAFRGLFSSFMRKQTAVSVASSIGSMLEDEIRFSAFHAKYTMYYDQIMKDMKTRKSHSYSHIKRVLIHSMNKKETNWETWPVKDKVLCGMKLLDSIMTSTDLVKKVHERSGGKDYVYVMPTEESLKWIHDHEEVRQFLHPERLPCIIKPDTWTGLHQGGYYTPVMRRAIPMIKAKHGKRTKKKVGNENLMSALNALQNVEWGVNTKVLDTLVEIWNRGLPIGIPSRNKTEIPPSPSEKKKGDMNAEELEKFIAWKREAALLYTQENERVSKAFQVARVVRVAQRYKEYDKFWFVWYADFRGRLYTATAGFSPQGPDFAKGLLRFAEGKALGERGWYWLRVHLANRYGFDKDDYDARVAWVDSRKAEFLAAADDPVGFLSVWSGADKPYQFLAALFEYADAVRSADPAAYVSHLPIGLDGSCNGLQNFSAMLRDVRGGIATNLVPGSKPADIYKEVALVLLNRINAELANGPEEFLDVHGRPVRNHANARMWLKYGIDRKLTKRSVMTMPYGSTRQSATEYMFAEIIKKNKNFFGEGEAFRAALWATPHLWKSIGDVVVAARLAMQWLQRASNVISKSGNAIQWTTPDGFVVYQKLCVIETEKIVTKLAGKFQGRIGNVTDEVDIYRQKNGISPNFVHSMDATHMRMVINELVKLGITNFSFIHDDYGTYACDTDLMHSVIREQFYRMYTEWDPLVDFKKEQEDTLGIELPDVPPKGELDLSVVKNSLFFFG